MDKDLSASMLAHDIGAEALMLLTDVSCVESGFGRLGVTDPFDDPGGLAGAAFRFGLDGTQSGGGVSLRGGDGPRGDDR